MARAKAAQRATQLAAEATPLKPPGQFAAPPYSSPLTDPQPLSKSTGAAAVAAAIEQPFLEPLPILQSSKPLASSGGNDRAARAAGRAEVRAKQEQDSQERAKAQEHMRAMLVTRLHGAGANLYETLKMEWVVQDACVGTERSIGMAFTAQLKAARLNYEDLHESRGWGVYELGALQRVLKNDQSLQSEVVAPSIARWKHAQAQVASSLMQIALDYFEDSPMKLWFKPELLIFALMEPTASNRFSCCQTCRSMHAISFVCKIESAALLSRK